MNFCRRMSPDMASTCDNPAGLSPVTPHVYGRWLLAWFLGSRPLRGSLLQAHRGFGRGTAWVMSNLFIFEPQITVEGSPDCPFDRPHTVGLPRLAPLSWFVTGRPSSATRARCGRIQTGAAPRRASASGCHR